jgi:hypothetical protein
MKKAVLSFFVFCSLLTHAQHPYTTSRPDLLEAVQKSRDTWLHCTTIFEGNGVDLEQKIIGYFSAFLNNPAAGLKVIAHVRSRIGHHIQLQLLYRNIPVYGSYIKVNIGTGGGVIAAMSRMANVSGWPEAGMGAVPGEAMWLDDGGKPLAAYRTYVQGFEIMRDMKGQVLFTRDLKMGAMSDDTLVSGSVFLPDPVSPFSHEYGDSATYVDNDDSCSAVLDRRLTVTFPASFTDSFRLENKYSRITDINYPNDMPPASATPVFDFKRCDTGFEAVMATFHIYNTQQYIQSIGFDSIVNYQIPVDPHSGIADNSYFMFTPDTALHFGLGGVDDAEDADIIVHEYTHAICHSINPSGVNTQERRALEEGMCDAMAAGYSRAYTPFNWKLFANWDGHNEYWNGRNCGVGKTYDNFDENLSFYSNSEIWSCTMCDLIEETGRDTAMMLMLTMQYLITPSSTMPEAAQLLVKADSLLFNSFNTWKIYNILFARRLDTLHAGISKLSQAPLFIRNSAGFAEGLAAAEIEAHGADLTLYDMAGRIVLYLPSSPGIHRISPASLPPGIYSAVLSGNGEVRAVKLARHH